MGEDSSKRKPDPVRMQALRNLPLEVKQTLTKEEVDAFLHEDVWPDSLKRKTEGLYPGRLTFICLIKMGKLRLYSSSSESPDDGSNFLRALIPSISMITASRTRNVLDTSLRQPTLTMSLFPKAPWK